MSETTPNVRVGIVGCGALGMGIGRELARETRATIAGVADIDAAARESAATAFDLGTDGQCRDLAALIEAVILDAVVVATPHTLHHDQVVTALDAGLHVLCEKPLATDLADARALADRAATSDTVLMVGYQRHLAPAFIKARERLAHADSDPEFITAEITQRWLEGCAGTWRTTPDRSGGGFLYDTGSHIIDAICWTTQLTPAWVRADMTFHDAAERVDSRALLTIGFEGGATASVSLYGDAPAVKEHIHIWDGDGAVYLEGTEWAPRRYRAIDDQSTVTEPHLHGNGPDKGAAFIDSILEGTEPPATAADALVVTAITEAAYESARTGERVAVSL